MNDILKLLYDVVVNKKYTIIENNEVKIKLRNGATYLDPSSFRFVAKRRYKVFKIDMGLKCDIVEQDISKELKNNGRKY